MSTITTVESIVTAVESIAELLAIENPEERQTVYVKSYHTGLGKGDGTFTYNSMRINENDGGLVLNGWVRQNENKANVLMFGAVGDGTTNDSVSIQKAIDAIYDLYIPEGIYLCNVILDKSFNICGSGKETILKPFNLNQPVLTNINLQSLSWNNDSLSNIEIRSTGGTGIGFSYGMLPAVNDYYGVGRVSMNNVKFNGLEKGIHKVNGNIGNKYYSCDFEYCKYGVYATSNQVSIPESTAIMHSGCDSYFSCNFSENTIAGVAYYDKTHGTGQWLFENCSFQFNKGFGLFFDFDIPDNLFSPIVFMNTWFEENGGNQVTIDRVNGQSQTLLSTHKFVFGTSDVITMGGEDYNTRMGIGVLAPKRTLHIHDKDAAMIQLTTNNTGSTDANRGGLVYFSYRDLILENKEEIGRLLLHTVLGKVEIDSLGNLVSRKAKIGYGKGAGVVVTQMGNKDQTVTCNSPSGRIITASTALASSSDITFVMNNSYILDTDVVVVNIKYTPSGTKQYAVSVSGIDNGSCTITIKNNSNNALSEAIEINYCVIAGSIDSTY